MKNRIYIVLALGLFSALIQARVEAQSVGCGFPPRSVSHAWSSRSFYGQYYGPGTARELAVIAQVLAGNVPDRLRQFVPLRLNARLRGVNVVLELEVAPDYLMIGTDSDFVRTPMTNYAAQYLAGVLGFVLPTPQLVDLIYAQAQTQLIPQPTDWYKHDSEMRTGAHYLEFNATIEAQRNGRGGLVAGHKKDVVLSNLLDQAPGKVAIYGWQRPGGQPIQPLGTPHDYYYEDYSHGIRFLGPTLKVIAPNGQVTTRSLVAALTDGELGPLLNRGAPIHDVRAARTCASDFAKTIGLSVCPAQPRICGS